MDDLMSFQWLKSVSHSELKMGEKLWKKGKRDRERSGEMEEEKSGNIMEREARRIEDGRELRKEGKRGIEMGRWSEAKVGSDWERSKKS